MSGFQASSNIELIAGPYRSGKTDASLKSLICYLKGNPFTPCLIVVPSSRHKDLLEKRLSRLLQMEAEERGTPCGIIGLNILPFYRACELALSASGRTARMIPDAVRPQIMARVLSRLKESGVLTQLSEIALYPGTHAALLELMDALARTGLSPLELSIKVQKLASGNSRILELARIYESYSKTMSAHGFLDKRQLAFAARELLYGGKTGALAFGRLIVDGFDRLSPLQISVIGGLARLSEKCEIIFDFDPKCLSEKEKGLNLAVKPHAQTEAEKANEETVLEYEWKIPSFRELIALLSPRRLDVEAPGKEKDCLRRSFSALDTFEEMHEIARLIKLSLRQGHCLPGDILVTARNLGPYRSAIEASFDSAGIPYFIDRSINLLELPLAHFIKHLITLSSNNFPRAPFISLLQSPYFAGKTFFLSKEIIEEVDRISATVRLVQGKSFWLELGQTKLSKNTAKALAKIMDLLTPPPGLHPLSFFAAWFEDLLEAFLLLDDEGEDLEARQREKQALAAVRSIICDLIQEENLLGAEKIAYAEFSTRFLRLMEAANFRQKASLRNYVTICDAELVPSRRFEEVYLCGLNEGVFPALSRAPLFLSAEEIALWSNFQVNIDNPRTSASFEFALFKSLVDRASSKLTLSFRTRNADNDELLPSFFLSNLKGREDAEIETANTWQNSLASPFSLSDAFASRLWHNLDTHVLNQGDAQGPASALNDLLAHLHFSAKSRAGKESLYNGFLESLVEVKALSIKMPDSFSASRLSEYGKCPFRYFASAQLKLSPAEEAEAGLNRKEMGTEYHSVLEAFYQELCTDGLKLGSLPEPELGLRLDAVLSRTFSAIEKRPYFCAGPLWLYEKQEMRFRLLRFLQKEKERQKAEGNLLPAMFEANFGTTEEGSYPPLKIEGKHGDIFLRGKIDRIDLPEGRIPAPGAGKFYASVVDYKSTSSAISLREAESGRNLQLPLYALAVKDCILPGSELYQGAYLSIGSGEAVGKFNFRERKDLDLLEKAKEHVRNFTDRISRGDFRAAPSDPRVCLNCDHNTVCRVGEIDAQAEEEDDD